MSTITVLQIGELPPPYGGISIHISSLKKKFDDNNIPNNVVKFKSFKFWKSIFNYNIIHSHDLSANTKTILPFFKLFGKKVILALHGNGLQDQLTVNQLLKLGWIGKFLLKKMLLYYDAFIVSNDKIKNFLVSVNVGCDRIHVIPEFIPIYDDWDYRQRKDILEFVDKRKIIFVTGDFRKYNSQYLYGFDMIIDMARKMLHLKDEFCFFVNLTNIDINEESTLKEIDYFKNQLKTYQLQKTVHFNKEPLPSALSLIKDSYVLLRPTNTDGNSVAILEALSMNVPALTSDVVPRPKSCVLFKNRDSDDMIEKFNFITENYKSIKDGIDEKFDSFEKIVDVYNKLLEK